jgi:hypothetical protein
MPDGTWLQYDGIRAEPGIIPNAEGQLSMNVKWVLDDSIPGDDWWTDADDQNPSDFGPFPCPGGPELTWAEDPSVGNGKGPTITVQAACEETP